MSAVPPSSCRAALLVEPGKPMEIADVRVPDVLERGALLAGCLSAGLDHYYRGLRFLERHADRIHWDDMITSTRPLEAINDAFEHMRDWSEIKPALAFAST